MYFGLPSPVSARRPFSRDADAMPCERGDVGGAGVLGHPRRSDACRDFATKGPYSPVDNEVTAETVTSAA
jgi:hypothetical protein